MTNDKDIQPQKHEACCGARVSPNITCSCSTPPVAEEKTVWDNIAEIDDHISSAEALLKKGDELLSPTAPSDWEQEFRKKFGWVLWNPDLMYDICYFITTLITQAKEEGRREKEEEHHKCNEDIVNQLETALKDVNTTRLATITLFEEFADDMELTDRKKKLPKKHDIMIAGMEELVKKGYNLALTDLLAFAEKMKANIPSHD